MSSEHKMSDDLSMSKLKDFHQKRKKSDIKNKFNKKIETKKRKAKSKELKYPKRQKIKYTKRCVTTLSHGKYSSKLAKKVKVPSNIRLIQYSVPGQLLTWYEANMILNNYCDTIYGDFYYVDKKDGEIIRSDIKQMITEPNESYVDLELRFTTEFVGNLLTGIRYTNIIHKNGKIIPNFTVYTNELKNTELYRDYNKIYLSNLLEYLSNKMRQERENEIIDVIQLSCKERDGSVSQFYKELTPERKEKELNKELSTITRILGDIDFKREIKNTEYLNKKLMNKYKVWMLYIRRQDLYKQFLNLFHIVDNKKDALEISNYIINNQSYRGIL